MPRHALTPSFCLKAKALAGAERTIFWHSKREGFGLVVTSSGHRSYVIQYRAAGKSRRMTIDGQLSLEEAERRAKVLQGQVAHGGDPLTEQRKERAAHSSIKRRSNWIRIKENGQQIDNAARQLNNPKAKRAPRSENPARELAVRSRSLKV